MSLGLEFLLDNSKSRGTKNQSSGQFSSFHIPSVVILLSEKHQWMETCAPAILTCMCALKALQLDVCVVLLSRKHPPPAGQGISFIKKWIGRLEEPSSEKHTCTPAIINAAEEPLVDAKGNRISTRRRKRKVLVGKY